MKMKAKSEAMASVHEAITDLYGIGAIGKTTMRHFDALCLETDVSDYSPGEIKALRERLNISQAVLAAIINASTDSIRKWEGGAKKPSGTALKLLNLLDHKGLEAVL